MTTPILEEKVCIMIGFWCVIHCSGHSGITVGGGEGGGGCYWVCVGGGGAKNSSPPPLPGSSSMPAPMGDGPKDPWFISLINIGK